MWWVAIDVRAEQTLGGDFSGVCIIITIPVVTRTGRWLNTCREYVTFRNRDLGNVEAVVNMIKERVRHRMENEHLPRQPQTPNGARLLYELNEAGKARIQEGAQAWGLDVNSFGAIP